MHFVENVLPWLPPGTLLFALLGVAVCRPLARALATRAFVAWLLVVSFGIIVSATLTPLHGAFETTSAGPGTCDLSVIALIPLQELVHASERSLNILLFIPLGVSLGMLPWSRRKLALILLAAALPFAIETTQMIVTALSRGCESIDMIDNLTGLVVGLVVGALIALVVPEVRQPSRPPSP